MEKTARERRVEDGRVRDFMESGEACEGYWVRCEVRKMQ